MNPTNFNCVTKNSKPFDTSMISRTNKTNNRLTKLMLVNRSRQSLCCLLGQQDGNCQMAAPVATAEY